MTKNIVILGSSYGGVGTAHRLLKQASKTGDVKVTLVGPTTHLYWNLAAPRAIMPGQFPEDKLFGAIAPGFKQYKADQFEFLVGTAKKLDLESKNVVVATAGGEKTVAYDILILATGTRAMGDAPWKNRESYEATRDTLHAFQEKVKNATSIVVGGAGPTGVETAGELGSEYGTTKKITLISSGARILESAPAGVAKVTANKLKQFKVTLKLETKILSEAKLGDGQTELTLSDGQKIVTDLYLPTTGLLPNSSFIPNNLLDGNGFVVVDEYLQVKGATDVWAVGDISSVQKPQYMYTDKQSAHVAKNIGLSMQGKEMVRYQADGMVMLAVVLGRNAGSGHMNGWKFPSFMITMIKSKSFFSHKLASTVDGSLF